MNRRRRKIQDRNKQTNIPRFSAIPATQIEKGLYNGKVISRIVSVGILWLSGKEPELASPNCLKPGSMLYSSKDSRTSSSSPPRKQLDFFPLS